MRSETRFLLSGGTTVTLGGQELRQVYEALWEMPNEPGAVSAAAIVLKALTEAGS